MHTLLDMYVSLHICAYLGVGMAVCACIYTDKFVRVFVCVPEEDNAQISKKRRQIFMK